MRSSLPLTASRWSFTGASRSDAVCKIRKSVAGFYAVHGLSQDKRAGFNVFDILSAAGRSGSTMQHFAAEFERSAKEPLERVAERIRQYDRDQFKGWSVRGT